MFTKTPGIKFAVNSTAKAEKENLTRQLKEFLKKYPKIKVNIFEDMILIVGTKENEKDEKRDVYETSKNKTNI